MQFDKIMTVDLILQTFLRDGSSLKKQHNLKIPNMSSSEKFCKSVFCAKAEGSSSFHPAGIESKNF